MTWGPQRVLNLMSKSYLLRFNIVELSKCFINKKGDQLWQRSALRKIVLKEQPNRKKSRRDCRTDHRVDIEPHLGGRTMSWQVPAKR